MKIVKKTEKSKMVTSNMYTTIPPLVLILTKHGYSASPFLTNK